MTKIYTYHNPNSPQGEYKDFISFEKETLQDANESIALFRSNKSRFTLWSITKGLSLKDFKMPTR
jgi:hypothetical protein